MAWVTLDAEDNDPVRFLSLITTACQRLHPDCGRSVWPKAAAGTDVAGLKRAVGALINDMAACLPEPFVLVLDDLHFVTEPAVFGCIIGGVTVKNHSFARRVVRIMLIIPAVLLVCVLILVGGLLAVSPGKPEPFRDETGRPLAGSISEKGHVNINGVEQGMFIRSKDQTKPVLLFLHGGPGMPLYAFSRQYPDVAEGLHRLLVGAARRWAPLQPGHSARDPHGGAVGLRHH